jgi:tetratricopeptide (TPR) repeat protein
MKKRIPVSRIVDLARGELSPEESLKLLQEIEQDERASRDLDIVASMVDVVDREGDSLFAAGSTRAETLSSRATSFIVSIARWLKGRPVYAGVAAFVVVFALIVIMLPPASPYASLASIREFDFSATVRGVELADVEAALEHYREGRYQEAIKLLERYVRAFPRSELLGYAHYSAGAAYLRWSEWDMIPAYVIFDQERVREGIEHLQWAVRISSNSRLEEDARWLLAKGYLMLSDREAAGRQLQAIEKMRGTRYIEATEMDEVLQGL